MASIIKIPSINIKGVVVFTTQDRDNFILNDKIIEEKIKKLKSEWLVGLHHNWHDYNFKYNPLFDFSFAGENDLKETNKIQFNQISLDACNFSPKDFNFSKNEKNWDILYVARAVFFKRIPEFFKIVRSLYDKKKFYRVLLICPIPDECNNLIKSSTVFCNVREEYDRIFSDEEKRHFTLLTTNFNNPFPFDIKTLSFFYKASKIFVHSAFDERRCRVVGYAHSLGMPVVCLKDPASLLPKELQKAPFVFIANTYSDFPTLIDEAINLFDSGEVDFNKMLPAIKICNEIFSVVTLKTSIEKLLKASNTSSEDYNFNNLDIRLGRHHGLGDNKNSCGWSINSFVDYLQIQPAELLKIDIKKTDPEKYILSYLNFGKILHKPKKKLNRYFYKSLISKYFPFIVSARNLLK
jgi:glycosyltransferase involved in cell wall biosynthesis